MRPPREPDRVPAEVFPPAEYLRDELAERGWTPADLAAHAMLPEARVGDILGGAYITLRESERLGVALGVSGEFFARLQLAWRRR
jgi:HTH-type transcriptional regulator / antitoxin HigA